MSQSKPVSFPKFPHLANEIQDLIWEWSIKDRPPAAHFAQLGHYLLVSRHPNGERGPFWTYTLIEDLSWCDPPRELKEICPQPPELHIDVLLRTCKMSRSVAMKHQKSWGPQGTLQLYDPRDKGRENTLDFSRDFTTRPLQIGGWLHLEYLPPRIYDLPSRKLDNSRDLVILGPEWIGVAHEFKKALMHSHYEWKIPIQRVPYLALTYTTRFHEFLDNQLVLITHFLRLRTEVLYILINPDEFDDDHTVVTTEVARDRVRDRRETLETPFPKRRGAADLVARAPSRFWYGKREYYELTWDEMEEKMMTSAPWRQLAGAIDKARDAENDTCDGCDKNDCNTRSYTFPAIWKVMSWKDPESDRPSKSNKVPVPAKAPEDYKASEWYRSPENNNDPESDNSSESNEYIALEDCVHHTNVLMPYEDGEDDWEDWPNLLPIGHLDPEPDKSSENEKDSE